MGKNKKEINDRHQMCPYCGKIVTVSFPDIGVILKKICTNCMKSYVLESEWLGKDFDTLSWVVYVQFGVKAEALYKGEFYGGKVNG